LLQRAVERERLAGAAPDRWMAARASTSAVGVSWSTRARAAAGRSSPAVGVGPSWTATRSTSARYARRVLGLSPRPAERTASQSASAAARVGEHRSGTAQVVAPEHR
jgi:hypothetical protein